MKQAPGGMSDKLIRLRRKYWDTGDVDILSACDATEEQLSQLLFHDDMHTNDMSNAIDLCAKGKFGLLPRATNWQIYNVLAAYGIEVVAETEKEETP